MNRPARRDGTPARKNRQGTSGGAAKSLLNPLTLLVVYSRIALPHPENLVRPELLLDNEATRTHYLGHPLLDQAATRW
ncbi:MAG: hypothetical protein U1U88_002498 [Lawsonella clevelandensis]